MLAQVEVFFNGLEVREGEYRKCWVKSNLLIFLPQDNENLDAKSVATYD